MNQNDDQPPEAVGADIRGAISHSLKAASSLVGDEKVISYFRDMVGKIVGEVLPIDAGGYLKRKGEEMASNQIKLLLES